MHGIWLARMNSRNAAKIVATDTQGKPEICIAKTICMQMVPKNMHLS